MVARHYFFSHPLPSAGNYTCCVLGGCFVYSVADARGISFIHHSVNRTVCTDGAVITTWRGDIRWFSRYRYLADNLVGATLVVARNFLVTSFQVLVIRHAAFLADV